MTIALHTTDNLESTEVDLLLEGVYQRYGYDFRDYARSSITRRILKAVSSERLETISSFQGKVLRDTDCMARFLKTLSINVTSMFRDPSFYRAFRDKLVPLLRSSPFVRIWHAGCATGEEIYPLDILLEEAGRYDRCRIYATDISEEALKRPNKASPPGIDERL